MANKVTRFTSNDAFAATPFASNWWWWCLLTISLSSHITNECLFLNQIAACASFSPVSWWLTFCNIQMPTHKLKLATHISCLIWQHQHLNVDRTLTELQMTIRIKVTVQWRDVPNVPPESHLNTHMNIPLHPHQRGRCWSQSQIISGHLVVITID